MKGDYICYAGFFIDNFWKWTKIPENMWWRVDLRTLKLDMTAFPQYWDVCNLAIGKINRMDTDYDMDLFLMALAINSEDEDILDACMDYGTDQFIQRVVKAGVTFTQSETRWQIAQLLRREIPGREDLLSVLCSDEDEYVRKRANSVLFHIGGRGQPIKKPHPT